MSKPTACILVAVALIASALTGTASAAWDGESLRDWTLAVENDELVARDQDANVTWSRDGLDGPFFVDAEGYVVASSSSVAYRLDSWTGETVQSLSVNTHRLVDVAPLSSGGIVILSATGPIDRPVYHLYFGNPETWFVDFSHTIVEDGRRSAGTSIPHLNVSQDDEVAFLEHRLGDVQPQIVFASADGARTYDPPTNSVDVAVDTIVPTPQGVVYASFTRAHGPVTVGHLGRFGDELGRFDANIESPIETSAYQHDTVGWWLVDATGNAFWSNGELVPDTPSCAAAGISCAQMKSYVLANSGELIVRDFPLGPGNYVQGINYQAPFELNVGSPLFSLNVLSNDEDFLDRRVTVDTGVAYAGPPLTWQDRHVPGVQADSRCYSDAFLPDLLQWNSGEFPALIAGDVADEYPQSAAALRRLAAISCPTQQQLVGIRNYTMLVRSMHGSRPQQLAALQLQLDAQRASFDAGTSAALSLIGAGLGTSGGKKLLNTQFVQRWTSWTANLHKGSFAVANPDFAPFAEEFQDSFTIAALQEIALNALVNNDPNVSIEPHDANMDGALASLEQRALDYFGPIEVATAPSLTSEIGEQLDDVAHSYHNLGIKQVWITQQCNGCPPEVGLILAGLRGLFEFAFGLFTGAPVQVSLASAGISATYVPAWLHIAKEADLVARTPFINMIPEARRLGLLDSDRTGFRTTTATLAVDTADFHRDVVIVVDQGALLRVPDSLLDGDNPAALLTLTDQGVSVLSIDRRYLDSVTVAATASSTTQVFDRITTNDAELIETTIPPNHYVAFNTASSTAITVTDTDPSEADPSGPPVAGEGVVSNGPGDDQILRLYRAVFGRAPDPGGFAFWTGQYQDGRELTSIVDEFIRSTEFQSRYAGGSDQDLVAALYVNVLDRPGEASGVAFWMDRLNDGATVNELLRSFADSPENIERTNTAEPLTSVESKILRLYRAVYGRAPDDGGFRFWVDQAAGGRTMQSIAAAFQAAPEFTDRYGSDPTDEELVNALYRNVLNRPGDAGGIAFWLDQRASGTTIPQLLIAFADSSENLQRTGTRP